MALSNFSISIRLLFLLSGYLVCFCSAQRCDLPPPTNSMPIFPDDVDQIQFALNLEYLETDWFLYGALGYGLDKVAPELARGGPTPMGVKKANLDKVTQQIITEFGFQEVGHLRAINAAVGGYPRPLIDLTSQNFGILMEAAVGHPLSPAFDPYANSVNYLLASYVVPYVGLVAYVGTNPNINGYVSKRLLAGLLGVESGQDAVIRTLLYTQAEEYVHPYNYTVAEFTQKISDLRNKLGRCGTKDEGLFVPYKLGAEKMTTSNILSADAQSISYKRTAAEIMRTVYGTGSERKPGGFFPNGGNGKIAKDLLK